MIRDFYHIDKPAFHYIDSLPRLNGKTVLLTGATQGIGRALALVLAWRGANLIIGARSAKLAAMLMSDCRALSKSAQFVHVSLDLADFATCEAAAHEIRSTTHSIDYVFLNAGMAFDRGVISKAKINRTFFVNHTAQFALMTALLDRFRVSGDSRIIVQSSLAHRAATGDFARYFHAQQDCGQHAYADSKLANILFANSLRQFALVHGLSLQAMAVHPGYLVSNINRHAVDITQAQAVVTLFGGDYKTFLLYLGQRLGWSQSSPLAAALPALHAAFAEAPYVYTGPGSWLELCGMPAPARLSPSARCAKSAHKLWSLSLAYCQQHAQTSLWHDLKV